MMSGKLATFLVKKSLILLGAYMVISTYLWCQLAFSNHWKLEVLMQFQMLKIFFFMGSGHLILNYLLNQLHQFFKQMQWQFMRF